MRLLVLALAALGCANAVTFESARPGEAVADLTVASPSADWSKSGREAAVVDVSVDGRPPFQVMLYAGAAQRVYPVFLGHLAAGRHEIAIARNERYSAAGCGIDVRSVAVRSGLDDEVIARAPVLYARRNTIGRFSDVPLVVYAERIGGVLQYTVIFSNEDGGTSTRALMARWGRTTDIEYVYRFDTATGRAIIQGKNHQDIEFRGVTEQQHPLLIPITDNNMVGVEANSEIRYQIAPTLVDLSTHSREHVMDRDPMLYKVMADELIREQKLRPFGAVDGQKAGDPRDYLYVEAKVSVENGGVVTLAHLKGESAWRMSSLGRHDYAVDRDGWIRTTVELPPGTRGADIAELGFTCAVVPDSDKKLPVTARCRVEAVSQVFLLDRSYRPQASIARRVEPVDLPAGVVHYWPLR